MKQREVKKSLTENKECIICNRGFLKRIFRRSRCRNMVGVRKLGSKTCSRKCAKEKIRLDNNRKRVKRIKGSPIKCHTLKGINEKSK